MLIVSPSWHWLCALVCCPACSVGSIEEGSEQRNPNGSLFDSGPADTGGSEPDTSLHEDSTPIDEQCSAPDANEPFDDTPICSCTLRASNDFTTSSVVSVTFTNKYVPRCISVKAGTTVTWTGNFLAHPLWASACAGDVERNPIHDVDDPGKSSLSILFTQPGTFPYYCPFHASDSRSPGGMCGVVYVSP